MVEGLPAIDPRPQSPFPTTLMSIFMLTRGVVRFLPETASHHYFLDYRTLRMVRSEQKASILRDLSGSGIEEDF